MNQVPSMKQLDILEKKNSAFSGGNMWRWCLFIVLGYAGICVFVAMLFPCSSTSRETPPEKACERHLLEISMMFGHYRQQSGRYPYPKVKGLHGEGISWRQQLVDLKGSSNSFDKEYHLNEPWNSEWNLSRDIPPYSDFICISEFRKARGKRKFFSDTSYLMLLRSHPIDQLPDTAVIVVESADSGIHWMEPRDLDMQTLLDSDTPFGVGKLNSYHDGHVNALRKNGEVIQISKSWSKEKVLAVLEGAEI